MGHRSIRTELLTLILILAVPVIGLQLYWAVVRYRSAVALAEEEVLQSAAAVATSTEQLLNLGHGILAKLAAHLAESPTLAADCSDRLRGLPEILFFSNVAVWDPAGTLVCSASPADSSARTAVGDRDWFREVMERGGPVVGEPAIGRITGRWVVTLAHPIALPGGQSIGAVGGGLALAELGSFLRPAAADEALVTIVTGAQAIIYRSQDPDLWVGKFIEGDEVPERGDGRVGSITRAVDMNQVARTFAKVPVSGTSWHVFVGKPDGVILSPVRRRVAMDAGAVVVILALAGAGGLGYYRRIARALLDLDTVVTSSAQGRPVAIGRHTPAEVRAVGERLNAAILARQKAQDAEREARERLQSVFDNSLFGIYVSTPDGRFLDVNTAMVSLLGFSSRDALLATNASLLYADPSRRDALVAQVLRDGSVANEEVEWIRQDGRSIIVRLNGRVIDDRQAGRTFQIVLEDVTEQRALEYRYRHAQQMELIGRMAGGIAHDFNNLLAVIIGQSELARRRLEPSDPVAHDLGQVLAAGQKAATLTRQLLHLSSHHRDKWEQVDIRLAVEELERMLGRVLPENIRMTVEAGTEVERVCMDQGKLDRMLMNLVLNARDALPHGGVIRITVRMGALPAGVRPAPPAEAREERWVVLAVADNGTGIAPAVQERIFEPFFTTKAPGAGTGLGLATVVDAVSEAGGYLHCDSTPGQGTTFTVFLPVAPPAAELLEQPHSVAPSAATILLVEDVAAVREVIRRGLASAGHQVHATEDAAEAQALLAAGTCQPDLLVTDVMMPGLSGPELAAYCRGLDPDLPVLFVSGYTDDETGTALADPAERTGFLGKPFTIDDLLAEVGRLLALSART